MPIPKKLINKLQIRDETLDLASPKIMGILNVTPDSFSDGGLYNSVDAALEHVEQMIEEGADIIDVGGESTRPGSDPVSEQQEIDRVIPVLQQAVPHHPDILFSIDTTRYAVAKAALEAGVHMVNDVSGLQREPRLVKLAAEYKAAYILMHSIWPPKTMQQDPKYDDVIAEVQSFFQQQLKIIDQADRQRVILDPGFGFGKTTRHNFTLLNNIEAFRKMGYPVLVGASRKTSIGEILNGRPAPQRVTGTVVAHYHALLHGANIIRVHDVQEAHDSVLMFKALSK